MTGALLALVLGGVLAEASPPLVLHWEKIRDKDGITVYRSAVPGTAVVAFKGEGRVEAPLLRVAHVIIDPSRGTEWVASLAESRVLRRTSPFEFLEYDRFSMPLFVKERDFVSKVTVEPDVSRRTVVVRFVSVEDAAMPPNTRCVRGQLVRSVFEPLRRRARRHARARGDPVRPAGLAAEMARELLPEELAGGHLAGAAAAVGPARRHRPSRPARALGREVERLVFGAAGGGTVPERATD